MTRPKRIWVRRAGGLSGGVLILIGTLTHVSMLAYLGGALIVAGVVTGGGGSGGSA